MQAVRLLRLVLTGAAALTLAGCGASDKAASGGAEFVPANAPAFVTVDTNADSGQWRQIEKLIEKFPDGDEGIRMLRSSFEDDMKLDWERDVKPALGDEIDLVWLDFEGGGTNVVAVTKPKDKEKFLAAVKKGNASQQQPGDEPLLVGEVDDWLVLSDSQAKIDRFKQQVPNGDSLADDATYKDAVAELPSDTLFTVFARGENLTSVFQKALGGITGGSLELTPAERPEFISAAFAAEDGGIRFVGATRTEQEAAEIQAYKSKLLADVPGDALAFLTFRGGALDKQLRQFQSNTAYRQAIIELERMLGLRLAELTGLFKNEVALYIRAGTPLPEFTLLLEAPDEAAAQKTIDGLLNAMTSKLPAQPCDAPPEQAGVKVSCVELGDFKVRAAAFDGKAVVTTGSQAIEEIRSGGPRLEDDEAFKDARGSAGLPDENAGFVWLDLEDGLPLVLGFADLSDEEIPAQLRRNLEPLRWLVAWTDRDGRTSSAELFLAID
jgi:hypothetical protein